MSGTHQPLIQDAWRDRLSALLTEQRDLVAKLSMLAEKQEQLIRDGKTEPLLTLLGERQELVDRVTARQDELSELTKNLDQRLEHVPHEQREALRELVDGITQDLSRVMERDEQDRSLLQTKRDETQDEIKSLSSARKAHHAYAATQTNTNRFADQQG